MNNNKLHNISEIIIRIKAKTASDEDRAYINSWLSESEENRQLYKRIVRGESLAARIKTEDDIHKATNYKQIQRDINRRMNFSRNRILLFCSSVAACALLFFVCIYEQAENGDSAENNMVTISNVTDNRGIVLITGDGNKIDLTSASTDRLLALDGIVKDNNELDYSSNSSAAKNAKNKIVTPCGLECKLTLSDGTKVWLNANSELEFPVVFKKGNRNVKLVGEAYFEVTHDESRPFIVESEGLFTRVLGTTFNVKAYPEDGGVYTTLVNGSVSVSAHNAAKEKIAQTVLTPGMQSSWSKNRNFITVQSVDTDNLTAWTRGEFVFNEDNLEDILHTLSRWYSVRFVYDRASLSTYTFSGMMKRTSKLATILEEFTLTGGPNFKIDGETIYITEK